MAHLGFIKRLSSALFSPKDIIKYRTDKIWVTILFFLFLLVLSILPVSISIVLNDGISYDTTRAIRTHFNENKDIPFTIIDGKLVHDDGDSSYVYTENIDSSLRVVFSLDNVEGEVSSTVVNIIFQEDGVYLSQSAFVIKLFAYNEYPILNNLDFSDLTDWNSPTWDLVFEVANQEVNKIKPTFDFLQIIILIISEALSMLFISLILAFFQNFTLSGIISFGKTWKMCIYVLAPYVVASVLGMLFNIQLLIYIGLGITAIYAASISRNILRESAGKDNEL